MHLNPIQIGEYIQAGRKELGMTQAELGERLNVSAQSVSNWERGETLPDIAILPDLAIILHCSVRNFVGRRWQRRVSAARHGISGSGGAEFA